ncbi:hypothetical protein BH23GEM9_BH23GEM9_23310 [soil metagenome]
MSVQSSPPAVTLLVLTWNAGTAFPAILHRMRTQRLDRTCEVLVIDSGSTDGTAEFLRQESGLRLLEIPHHEFNHGATRDLGILESRGEIVVLAAQDAEPADEQWMQHLVNCFDSPEVAGAYSRQIVRPDANPFIRSRLNGSTATTEAGRVQRIASRSELHALHPLDRKARVAFDNVSSSVRRRVALEIPFGSCRFGEDMDWAHRVLLAGHSIIYEPRSRVIHSHDRSIAYEFRRVYLDHQQLYRLLGVRTVPHVGALLWQAAGGTVRLLRSVAGDARLGWAARISWGVRALPFAFAQTLAQYLGARSARGLDRGGHLYSRLDGWLGRNV